MKKHSGSQQTARQRAEVIMKVRCGLMSASQAATLLGVSRKTYYKWEQRGLAALLGSLEDQHPGRPAQPADNQQQSWKNSWNKPIGTTPCSAQDRDKGRADGLKLQPGCDRAKKK
jgi:DNA-binding XRE family transcriptional regulator